MISELLRTGNDMRAVWRLALRGASQSSAAGRKIRAANIDGLSRFSPAHFLA
jgi:hypothetical protein